MSDITEDSILIEDAHPVRNEGTIIIFEGILFHDDDPIPEVVWFGVDHSVAGGVAAAAEEGMAVAIEAWQIVGRTEVTS